MRVPKVRTSNSDNRKKADQSLWKSAANIPNGTTPIPMKQRPMIAPKTPQKVRVVTNPSIHTVAPKR